MTIEVINRFDGEHLFLSNFDTAPFRWRGVEFKGGEYALQWAKLYHLLPHVTGEERAILWRSIIYAPTPNKAKYYGRVVPLDVDTWNERRIHYMREIVHAKFAQVPDYAGKLIRTGARPLVEGNDWNDTFWGKCRQPDGRVVGLNMLGTILMEERGYWLWGQSPELTKEQAERTADYG